MKRIRPPRNLVVDAALAGDKSLSHRALILAAMANGVSTIRNLGSGEDVRTTRIALETLGVEIEEVSSTSLRVTGGINAPAKAEIDCGNSGTSARLLTGLLAGIEGVDVILYGDVSLSKRPMRRIVEPLRAMGAEISFIANNEHLPIRIHGKKLKGRDYHSPIASAQVKGALMLATLYADGPTKITEPALSRDHSEIIFDQLGASVITVDHHSVVMQPLDQPLKHFEVSLLGDVSSAAALLTAAAIHPNGQARIERSLANPTRMGYCDAIRRMGAKLDIAPGAIVMGEASATLTLTSAPLEAIDLPAEEVARAIDEIPLLALLATQAKGESRLRGLAELRVKESDRLAETVRILSAFGAELFTEKDDLIVRGPSKLKAASIRVGEDHRMVMLATLAALIADGESVLEETESIGISFPDFFSHLHI